MQRSQVLIFCLLATALGCGVGFTLARALDDQPSASPEIVSPSDALPPEDAPAESALPDPQVVTERSTREHVDPTTRPAPVAPAELGELISAALLAHHEAEFLAGWHSERESAPDGAELDAAEAEFREMVLKVSRALGHRGAAERTQADHVVEELEQGDWIALIARAAESEFQPLPEHTQTETLELAFTPRTKAGTLSGEAYLAGPDSFVTEGLTLQFGPGVHALYESQLRGEERDRFPSDVTILGAGRDATLLTIGDISIRPDVERLTFRDLTLDCGNDGLFDLRNGALTLRMERVRVVRFDAGHGGCSIFSVRGGALVWASECEFTGGFGRSPGNGGLFHLNAGVLRFDRCSFDLVRLDLPRSPSCQVLFQGCQFGRLTGAREGWQDKVPANVRFESCSYEPIDGSREKPESRELSELFWQLETPR